MRQNWIEFMIAINGEALDLNTWYISFKVLKREFKHERRVVPAFFYGCFANALKIGGESNAVFEFRLKWKCWAIQYENKAIWISDIEIILNLIR